MSKQPQQLGPLSEQANGICFCPHLDGCFSEWGQRSPSMVHSLWPDGSGKKTLEMRLVISVMGLSTWTGSPGSF